MAVRRDDGIRMRLQQVGLGLFRERGYERTTAAEIAKHAGVTERTFFRHFLDKREVLFEGEAILRTLLTAAIADGPDDLAPLEMLFRAFRSIVPTFEANRPFAKPRHDVIAATPALQERELAKLATLADVLATALQARGVGELRAILAARAGMGAFTQATVCWLEDPSVPLAERFDLACRELRALLAEGG